MTIYLPPQEPDEGLFYVRVWRGANGDAPLETSYSSLREATAVVNAVYAERNYSRIEFLQAREWGTRSLDAVPPSRLKPEDAL